jgi:hypothetical protein
MPAPQRLGGHGKQAADPASLTARAGVPGSSWRFADIPTFPAARPNAELPPAGGRSPQPHGPAPVLQQSQTRIAAACTDGIDLQGNGQGLTDQVASPDAGTPAPDAGTQTPAAGTQALDAGTQAPDAGTKAPDAGAPVPAQAPDAGAPAQATTATFGPVNSSTTPAGMGARIPPSVDQSISVTITGPGSVNISVDGASAANGMATVEGAATKTLTASGTVKLRGTAQTKPGSAGNLGLLAKAGGTTVGRSNAFTICAIPTTVTISPGTPITGAERGVDVPTSNNSDSGQIADLDQVQMSEKVQYVNGTGCFAGITSGDNSGFLPANASPHGTDHHGTPVALITGAGSIDSRQMFVFNDARSGAASMPVTNSGFNIHREVTATAAGDAGTSLSITTSKAGMATTVRGTSASAGSGTASSGAQPV